jgi:hypothetical protein
MNLFDKRKVIIVNIVVPIIYYIVLVIAAQIKDYKGFNELMSFTVPFIIGYLVTTILTVYDLKNKKLTENSIKFLILYHLPTLVVFIVMLIAILTVKINY